MVRRVPPVDRRRSMPNISKSGKPLLGNNDHSEPEEQLGLTPDELSLLQACELGDIQRVTGVLKEHPTVNVDCVDLMGRTPLQITVEREDKDLMEVLLPLSSKRNVEFTLLDAINDKKESIACAILRHPVYASPEFHGGQKGFAETTSVLTKFHPDTTPLVLAAQRNLYELVKVLVMSGERIERPHPYLCNCHACIVMADQDQLRYAQRRLNAYKGLSSESYLSLANEDPLLEAFRLGREMKQTAKLEKHFKTDYEVIAEALSEFVVKILDRVRDNQELEMILNKVDDSKSRHDEFEPAARIKMAVINKEKKFVAHPSCQMTLSNMWYGHIRHVERAPIQKKFLYFTCFLLFYPFMALLYIFLPKAQIMIFMRSPLVKFMAQTYSYIAFISFIISWTFTLSAASSVKLEIPSDSEAAKVLFKEDESKPGNTLVRFMTWEFEEWMILAWVAGFLWQECKQLHQEGPRGHLRSMYNVLDFAMIALYMSSYSLKGVSIYKAQHSVKFFMQKNSFARLINKDPEAIEHHYWVTPDRFYWDKFDPYHVSEGIFAIANVLTFSRISAMLPVNEVLGPMQISLGRMLNDILRFMMIFLLIIVAFMVGLDNLYWFYDASVVGNVSLKEHGMTKGGESFGNIEYTFRSVFWGMFGLMDYDIVDLAPYDAIFTRNVGYILYGCYIICIVIVLLNMLIAMMSLSFQQIADDSDVEWKFARSKLYLEYIEDGQTLPPPLNVIPTPKSIWRLCLDIKECFTGLCNPKPVRNNKTNELFMAQEAVRGQNIQGSQNMTLIYGFIPIYHDNESNGTFLDHKGMMEGEAKPTYKDMMAKVVERFVYDMTTGGEGDTEDELDGLRQEVIFLRRHLVTSMELQDKQLKDCRNEINDLKKAIVGLNTAQNETYTLSIDVGKKTQLSLEEIARQLQNLAEKQAVGYQGPTHVTYSDLSYVEWARMRSVPPPVPGGQHGRSRESSPGEEPSETGPPNRWVDDPPYLNHR